MVEKKIEALIKQTIESIAPSTDTLTGRASALSDFCEIFFVMTWLKGTLPASYAKDFYCGIGTVVHANMQKWLGVAGSLYGMWECLNCKTICKEGFGPVTCTICDTPCTYKEYSLKYKGISGHCDGLFLIDNKFYIFELKTISLNGLRAITKEGPYIYHSNQANMYTLMGQKLNLPFPLVGNVIVYVARDNYTKFKVFVQNGIDLKKIENTIKNYYKIKEMFKTGTFKDVQQKCKVLTDAKYCPYKSLCFRGNIDETLTYYWNLDKNEEFNKD